MKVGDWKARHLGGTAYGSAGAARPPEIGNKNPVRPVGPAHEGPSEGVILP